MTRIRRSKSAPSKSGWPLIIDDPNSSGEAAYTLWNYSGPLYISAGAVDQTMQDLHNTTLFLLQKIGLDEVDLDALGAFTMQPEFMGGGLLPAAEPTAIRETTVLGENMAQRVMPFAERTGGRTLGFGATADEWAAMTPQQRWRLNDGMLRARMNAGDAFRYIGQDPLRNPALRQKFNLPAVELLRLESRGIPYQTVLPNEVLRALIQP